MRGGDLIKILLFRFTGQWIKHRDNSVQSGKSESLLDGLIVFLLRYEREQGFSVVVLVTFKYGFGDVVQWHFHRSRVVIACLFLNVL